MCVYVDITTLGDGRAAAQEGRAGVHVDVCIGLDIARRRSDP